MYYILDKLMTVVSYPFFYLGWVAEFIGVSMEHGRARYQDDAYRIIAMTEARDE